MATGPERPPPGSTYPVLGSGDQEREGARQVAQLVALPTHSGWLWHSECRGAERMSRLCPKGKMVSREEGWPGVSGSSVGGKAGLAESPAGTGGWSGESSIRRGPGGLSGREQSRVNEQKEGEAQEGQGKPNGTVQAHRRPEQGPGRGLSARDVHSLLCLGGPRG